KFEYSIEIASDIDEEHHYIPPMLAQPFIENAIEHGIIHLSSKGFINIRFSLSEPNIILEVEDNGVGIEKSAEFNSKKREEHKSLAKRITTERLRNLRRAYGRPIKMETIDLTKTSETGTRGTLVRFSIPLIVK
ncbi:MAG: histidine kinase, partial [Bacteroidetes bacterium HGW-Bacteroidetes-15]